MNLESNGISNESIGEKVVIRESIKLTLLRLEGDFAVVSYVLHGQDLELKLPKNVLTVDQDAVGSGWLA